MALATGQRWDYRTSAWRGTQLMAEVLLTPRPGERRHLRWSVGMRTLRFESDDLILLALEWVRGNAPLEPLLDCLKERADEAMSQCGESPYPNAAAVLDREFP